MVYLSMDRFACSRTGNQPKNRPCIRTFHMKGLMQKWIGIMEKIHQSQAPGAAVHLYC